MDFVSAFVGSNIPLEAFDSEPLREVLRKHVKCGGAFPKASTLRSIYFPRIYEAKLSEVKLSLQRVDSFSVVVDEQCDVSQDLVLHILAVPQSDSGELRAIILSSEYLEVTNATTVAQAVIRVLHEWSLDLNKVSAFVTDNAAYCSKAFKSSLQNMLPNAFHHTCNAHILALVADEWRSAFEQVDNLCGKIKRMFSQSVARKRRYITHLRDSECTDISLPPVPIVTRWTSWYKTVAYHSAHFRFYKEFFQKEKDHHYSKLVETILNILDAPHLQEELSLIETHCSKIQAVLTSFEESSVTIHKVYDKVLDLLA